MSVAERDFDYVRKMVFDRSAIVLEPTKTYLVESRLGRIVRRAGLKSVRELIARLRADAPGALHHQVVEAMITYETSFFRDGAPFDALRDRVIPDLQARATGAEPLTIWCAACSSGQEPYSIAMLLREHFPSLDARIVATDVSEEILARAQRGSYAQIEVSRGLPLSLRDKYFTKNGAAWQVQARIRETVEFRQLNLAAPWPVLPRADVIFLRNVLIYFSEDVKRRILANVREVLRPDGVLVLGAAETTLNLSDDYERESLGQASFYRPTKR